MDVNERILFSIVEYDGILSTSYSLNKDDAVAILKSPILKDIERNLKAIILYSIEKEGISNE